MIENGATDARYFYFGKIISTVLQTAYAASQILKIISKLGPELVKLSTAFSGGTTVKIVGEVAAVANDAGMSAEEAETLTGMLGWAAAGVVFIFGTVVGADNAAKLVKAFKEGDSETGNWNKGSFDSPEDSLNYHYRKHGDEVGATSRDQYLRKAEEFAKTAKKGSTKSQVDGAVEGTIRYKKNGKYIDIAPDGSIVSFGKQ